MQHHRLFAECLPEAGNVAVLDEAESRHAVRALRLGAGDAVTLLDGHGGRADAVVADAPSGRRRRGPCVVRVTARDHVPSAALRITLCVAPPRGRLMGRIVRQATELGVATIVPILCRYSVSRPAQGATHSWELDAKAALKQSGNAWLPEISPPVAFADALSSSSGPVVYGAVPIADAEAPPEALPGSGDISVWVGPEGGFAAEELRALEEAGGQPLCVGPHVLRVDTAVCAVLACVYTLVSRSG